MKIESLTDEEIERIQKERNQKTMKTLTNKQKRNRLKKIKEDLQNEKDIDEILKDPIFVQLPEDVIHDEYNDVSVKNNTVYDDGRWKVLFKLLDMFTEMPIVDKVMIKNTMENLIKDIMAQ